MSIREHTSIRGQLMRGMPLLDLYVSRYYEIEREGGDRERGRVLDMRTTNHQPNKLSLARSRETKSERESESEKATDRHTHTYPTQTDTQTHTWDVGHY